MQTFLARAFVTGYSSLTVHRLTGNPVSAHLRFHDDDTVYNDMPTSLDSIQLLHLACETNPRIFAIDVCDRGLISLRVPHESERDGKRKVLSSKAQLITLLDALRDELNTGVVLMNKRLRRATAARAQSKTLATARVTAKQEQAVAA